jgi:TPR repeat protein
MIQTPPHSIRRWRLSTAIVAALIVASTAPTAHADSLARGTAAYSHGNYIVAARELTPLALRGNPKALGLLGFLYENGFGEPQAYDAAADFYAQAAVQGNPFAQAMLGLLYDKGHGVPQDFIFAYKWLNLAAAHTNGHEHDTYARFRDAVASKMSKDEIAEGQWLALHWIPVSFEPWLRAERGTWESRHRRE